MTETKETFGAVEACRRLMSGKKVREANAAPQAYLAFVNEEIVDQYGRKIHLFLPNDELYEEYDGPPLDVFSFIEMVQCAMGDSKKVFMNDSGLCVQYCDGSLMVVSKQGNGIFDDAMEREVAHYTESFERWRSGKRRRVFPAGDHPFSHTSYLVLDKETLESVWIEVEQ